MLKLASLLCLVASAGWADIITLDALPKNTEFGTYNGFIFATINGTPDQLLICDDFGHTSYVPSGNMLYTMSSLIDSNPLDDARFIDPSDPDSNTLRYREAAVLLEGLSQTGPASLFDLTADYQYALWALMTPTVSLPRTTPLTLLTDALHRVQNGSPSDDALYARLRIFTPTQQYASNQEFLQLTPDVPQSQSHASVPEAQSAILMLIGLALIVSPWAAKRLRHALHR